MIDQLAIFLNVTLTVFRHLANLKTHAIEPHNKIIILIIESYLAFDLVKSSD
jgi:hypothetical protein